MDMKIAWGDVKETLKVVYSDNNKGKKGMFGVVTQ
jgi:hypothetical protein